MTIRPLLRGSVLSAAVLLAFAPPAPATDFIFSSGLYAPGSTAPEPLTAGDVLQINSGSNKFFSGITFTNQSGLVNWSADTLFMQNGALIANQSVWDAKVDATLVNNGGALSSFANSGIFRKSAGAGSTTIGSLAFVNGGTVDAQSGTINFSGGNATFNAGSQFTGAGSTIVTSNAAFNGSFTSANLTLVDGVFSANAAQVNGTVGFSGGVLAGTWEVAAGQTLNGVAGTNKFLSGGVLTNNSTFAWQTGNPLFMQNGSSIVNNAVHDIQATSSIVNNGGALPTYTNAATGMLRVAGGETATIGTIAFVNNGGQLVANGLLNFNGGNATFNDNTTFAGAGTNLVTSDAAFNGSVTSSNLVLQSGNYSGGAAVLHGTANFTGGAFTGSWQVAAGGTLNAKTGVNKFLNGAAFTNSGNVVWQTTDSLFMQNGSQFDNQANFTMTSGAAIVNNGGALSSFVNSGTFSVAAGETGTIGSIAFVNNGGTLAADGTLNFNGGNANFNAASVFTGAGAVAITSNAVFNGDLSSTNLSLRSGVFFGNAARIASGGVEFSGGSMQGDWEVAAGQSLFGRGGINKFLNGVALINRGTLAWQTGESLFMQNGSLLDNRGLVDMQVGAAIVNNGGALSTFDNRGTLRVGAGQNAVIGSIAFVSNGGTSEVGAGGSLNYGGGNATFNPGTVFSGAGVNMVTNNASFSGAFSSGNLSLRSGVFSGNNATLNGSAEFSGGSLVGTWNVAGGATLNDVSGINKFLDAATLTNSGTMVWKTGETLFFQNASQLTNQGTIDLQADSAMVFNGGAVGSFVNTGLIRKSAGTGTSLIGNNLGFDNQGVVDVESGTIALPNGFTNNGTLKGIGAFATDLLTNAGHVAPGSSPGMLTLNANYVQTGAGSLDVELASSGLFDSFIVNGTASLTGTLALHCVLTCNLHNGDVFVILDSTGDLAGTFASVTTAGFNNGFQYSVIYDTSADLVKLQVINAGTPPVPEPRSGALMFVGLGMIAALVRRRGPRD